MDLSFCSPLVKAAIALPRWEAQPQDKAAWQAHVDAGRIGGTEPPAGGGEFGCAGLARACGLPHPE